MKKIIIQLFLVILLVYIGYSQTNPVFDAFPKATILHGNIHYNNDPISKHLLYIYLPLNAKGKVPLVILVHGRIVE